MKSDVLKIDTKINYVAKGLRTFTARDSITMMTLFKSLVLPRLDYGSQLWSLI